MPLLACVPACMISYLSVLKTSPLFFAPRTATFYALGTIFYPIRQGCLETPPSSVGSEDQTEGYTSATSILPNKPSPDPDCKDASLIHVNTVSGSQLPFIAILYPQLCGHHALCSIIRLIYYSHQVKWKFVLEKFLTPKLG